MEDKAASLEAELIRLRGNEQKLYEALRMLFNLLDFYGPPWYDERHYQQAEDALRHSDPERCVPVWQPSRLPPSRTLIILPSSQAVIRIFRRNTLETQVSSAAQGRQPSKLRGTPSHLRLRPTRTRPNSVNLSPLQLLSVRLLRSHQPDCSNLKARFSLEILV